ncbi:UPF0547 protein C16orf87 homolog [Diorhabda carinulata]|uniref:UPF0547 protein C16orf87 homolog n=1 Tax=Diorhabda carinulata TaxID=1163345 RepID=UPI00259FE518|nr:UPF0547 protein C16orf87 homolog [Diorhabda carinulata]
MPKKTMIAKICPTCKQQVPVACKSCPCGHFFYNAKRIAREFAIEADYRRRTSRVRRGKPNYYDALEFDKHIKKIKKRTSECDNEEEEDNKKDNGKSKKKKVKKDEEEDDEALTKLTPELQQHCQSILDQINIKLKMVTWKPT